MKILLISTKSLNCELKTWWIPIELISWFQFGFDQFKIDQMFAIILNSSSASFSWSNWWFIAELRKNGVTELAVWLWMPLDLASCGLKKDLHTLRIGVPRFLLYAKWMRDWNQTIENFSRWLLNWKLAKAWLSFPAFFKVSTVFMDFTNQHTDAFQQYFTKHFVHNWGLN